MKFNPKFNLVVKTDSGDSKSCQYFEAAAFDFSHVCTVRFYFLVIRSLLHIEFQRVTASN